MASGWLQPLVQRLAMWTAPFLTGGGGPVDEHGRTVVYRRWRPPMSYSEFVARHRRQEKPAVLRDEPVVFSLCRGRGHLQAAQRWRDTCAGCGADIPVGAVGPADHARTGADMAGFGHACGVSNPPTQTAVALTEDDDGLARQVRARIVDRADAAQEGTEDGADPRQQRLLVADGLDAVCADLIAGLRDRLRSLVSDEVNQENHHRTRQLAPLLDAAMRNLYGYESLTAFADAFPVTLAGDQPARPPGSRLCFDLPIVPASSLTVHAWTRAACPPGKPPEFLHVEQVVPADTASAVILAHNATLAAAAVQ